MITKDKKLAKAVTRTLVPQKIEVEHFDVFPDPNVELDRYGFVLIDGDLADAATIDSGLKQDEATARVIVFSRNRETPHLAELLGKGNLTNFIAKNGGIREDELLITMHKLLTRKFFGMEQYLTHGTQPVERELLTTRERVPALTELCSFLKGCLVSGRFIELARNAADELLMNALERALSEAGEAPDDEHAEEGKSVIFQYACDGRHVAISVADGYGSLTGQRLLGFLSRCFTMVDYKIPTDTQGAGLGLFVAFNSADQFVVNIAQGIRTEVICLIDIRGHLRDFEGRSKSFHLFITEGGPCPTT